MQNGPICKLATTPGITSEMRNILEHMGVTAYGPRHEETFKSSASFSYVLRGGEMVDKLRIF